MATTAILCPTDCTTGALPNVAFDFCAPSRKFGEIRYVYLAAVGQPLTLGDAAEFTTRLAAVDDTKIVRLIGKGSKAAGAGEVTRYSSLYTIQAAKDQTVALKVIDLNETNYDFARQVDKCGGKYLMWYETADGMMFGGDAFNDGNEVSVTVNDEIPEDDKTVREITFNFSWTGPMPASQPSPVA